MRSRVSIVLPLSLFVAMASYAQAADVATTVKVFQIQHSSVMEAAEAVQPLLSVHGSLTVQPRQSRITVQDTPEVMAKVTEVLAKLDRAPGAYAVEVELLHGSNAQPDRSKQAAVDERLKRMFPFKSYRRIGTAVFEGELGTPTSAVLGEGYRIAFLPSLLTVSDNAPWGMPNMGNRIELQDLVLEKVTEAADGAQAVVEVVRSNVQLSPRQEALIGAGASEDSSNGLVLIVRSKSEGAR